MPERSRFMFRWHPRLGAVRWSQARPSEMWLWLQKRSRPDWKDSQRQYKQSAPVHTSNASDEIFKSCIHIQGTLFSSSQTKWSTGRKLRTSKIKFRVSPRMLLSSTTPSWVIPATGALWVFLICLMPMMLPAAACLSVGPAAALGMQGRQWEERPWLPFSATHPCICNRRRAGEGLLEFVWM